MRFDNAAEADLAFVPAGSTWQGQAVDVNPTVIHVDTGGGRFDHHQRKSQQLCAAELTGPGKGPQRYWAASSHHQLGCPPSWVSISTPSGT